MHGYKLTDNFYNHMPAEDVKRKLGDAVFGSYFKFCVVRNPYDKTVSRFWWDRSFISDTNEQSAQLLPFDFIRASFKKYVLTMAGKLCDDRNIYTIDNTIAVDGLIRFENLTEDTAIVCEQLNVDFVPNLIGSYKSGYRLRREHWSEYYDKDTIALIQREFSFEINEFGYRL